jgi:hypothetical protein
VGALLAKLLPELALVGGAVVYALAPGWQPWIGESLEALVFIEVIFSLAQLTLTDIATRLRKPPPLWAGGLLVVGLGVLYPEVGRVVMAMAREGWPVFLPFAWSLVERSRELWTMPRASELEKMRRRALVSGRMGILFVVVGAFLAVTAIRAVRSGMDFEFEPIGPFAFWWVALAFALSSFDIVRVHRPAFERRPRALFGRLDPLGVRDLSPL